MSKRIDVEEVLLWFDLKVLTIVGLLLLFIWKLDLLIEYWKIMAVHSKSNGDITYPRLSCGWLDIFIILKVLLGILFGKIWNLMEVQFYFVVSRLVLESGRFSNFGHWIIITNVSLSVWRLIATYACQITHIAGALKVWIVRRLRSLIL